MLLKIKYINPEVLQYDHIIYRNDPRIYSVSTSDGHYIEIHPDKKIESISANICTKNKEDMYEINNLIMLGEANCIVFLDGCLIKGFISSIKFKKDLLLAKIEIMISTKTPLHRVNIA